MNGKKTSITILILLIVLATNSVLAQSRPTLEQLIAAQNSLEITFIFNKQQYFPGEIFKGQIKVKNPTNSTLIVPKVFHPEGEHPVIVEIDPLTGEPPKGALGRLFGTRILDENQDFYGEPFPLESLTPGDSRTLTLNPSDPQLEFTKGMKYAPYRTGKYKVVYLKRPNAIFDFEVVLPSVESVAEALWPTPIGGEDPNDPPGFDPIRQGYRKIFSARWQGQSRVCLSVNLGNSIAGVETSLIGSAGIPRMGSMLCFAESALPITSVSGTHDGAKNLTVSYTDSQAITRTFRVDENLNLLP